MTIKEAAMKFVQELNAYPQDMIEKLMTIEPDAWTEVTKPSEGDYIYLFNIPTEDSKGNEYEGSDTEGEILEILNDDDILVELHDGTIVIVEDGEFEVQRDGFLPMWGTMWSFGSSIDEWWLEEKDGLQKMLDCGFRIYYHDEWGYFFGIDGAGYDFYETHWIPLYKKRGLQWHDSEEDK